MNFNLFFIKKILKKLINIFRIFYILMLKIILKILSYYFFE